jgi:alkylhydroperoxidase/carboxymuconolactone decarboxylase family protein YurZ
MLKVSEEDLSAALKHYENTLGVLPEVIQLMVSKMPAVFEGYARMRSAVMAEDSQIPGHYKELIFILLDLATGSIEGALVHTRVAMSKGLSIRELTEALAQAVLVLGISIWDRGGAEILNHALQHTAKEES